MRCCLAFLTAACLATASTAPAETPAVDQVVLKAPDAVVFDAEGKALFRGSQDFILALAGNQTGRVFNYDVLGRRVRVTAEGKPELWLACADLEPMASACRRGPRFRSPPSGEGPSEPAGRGIPSCPGDPRCPRLGD